MGSGLIYWIIGILVGLSGWAAFWLQVRTNRRDVEKERRNAEQRLRGAEQGGLRQWAAILDNLHRLVGKWLDGITESTEFAGTFDETARRINTFIDLRGGFENETTLLLELIPETRFAIVRERVEQFRTDALDIKKGLVRDIANDNYRPADEQWPTQREEALRALRSECDGLLLLLGQESRKLRTAASESDLWNGTN